MADHKSAKKSIRQIKKRTEDNRARMSDIRTFVKKVEEAITAKDKKKAMECFVVAQSKIMRGVEKSLYKAETASRRVSRLSKRIKTIAA